MKHAKKAATGAKTGQSVPDKAKTCSCGTNKPAASKSEHK